MNEIAYVAHMEDGPCSGVGKKIINQVSAMVCSSTRHCSLYIFTNNKEAAIDWRSLDINNVTVRVIIIGNGIVTRQFTTFLLLFSLLKKRPDLGYLRSLRFYLGEYVCLLLFPFVLEVNSNDLGELASNKLALWYQKLMRGFYLRNIVGFVFVSKFIGELSSYSGFKKKSTVISNGHDESMVDWAGLRLPRPELDNEFSKFSRNVFFLGSSAQPWQGVDKILEMAVNLPDVGFHLVGEITLSNKPSNVHVYGYLPLSQYQYIIARCDVAIGPLALHRKHMGATSALKVAEYIMFKKPVILAYHEDDFSQGGDYILQLPNHENCVSNNLDTVRLFIHNSPRLLVPDSIIKKMSMFSKNQARSAFLSSIVDSCK